MSLDVQALRDDTPGCREVHHLNNAGSALPPTPVVDAVVSHLHLEAAIGGYEAADLRAAEVGGVYDAVARLLGARSDEIALVESATRAWQAAAYAVPLRAGDRVLVGRSEYASGWIGLQQRATWVGASLEVVPDDVHGQLDTRALAGMLDERVALVAVGHAAAQSGLLNPVGEVGRLLRDHPALYLLDACQSIGQVTVDVEAIGCDLACGTGRKYLRGPRGTGFLYVSRRIRTDLVPHVLDLHAAEWTTPTTYDVRADARAFEVWERSYANLLGLGAAVHYLLGLGVQEVSDRILGLADTLRRQLGDVPGVSVTDRGELLGGIVTFTVEGQSATQVRDRLRARRVHTSAIEASTAQLDLGHRDLAAVVRASPHVYNDEADLEALVSALTP